MLPHLLVRRILYLLLALGLFTTTWGLHNQKWPQVLPWSSSAFLRYAVLLLTTSFLIGAWAYLKKTPIAVIVCILLTLGALATGAFWPLIVTIFFITSSWTLGNILLSRISASKTETSFSTTFLTGAGIYGTGVGLLAHLPFNYPGLYAAALLFPILIGWRKLTHNLTGFQKWAKFSGHCEQKLDFVGVSIASMVIFHFTIALLPEVSFDALALHLLVPSHLASRHQWGFDPSYYSMALIPMLGNWIFSIGFVLADETGARLLNLSFTLLLAWQVGEFVRLVGGNRKGVKWASLLFLTTPLTLLETGSLHVEAIWGSFIVGGVIAIFRGLSLPQGSNEIPKAGLLFGFAAAAKAVTLSYLPATLIFAVSFWQKKDRKYIRALAIGTSLFIAAGIAPYVTSWFISGNPVHPFFNAIFKSPFYPPVNFDNQLFKSGTGWDTLYNITFHSEKYLEATNGAAGFQWLLLLPATTIYITLARRWKALIAIAFCFISIATVFHSQSYLRYIFPATLLLTGLVGVALSTSPNDQTRPRGLFTLLAILALVLNVLFITAASWAYRDMPIHTLFSKTDRDSYIESRLPIRHAVELVNLINSEGSPVAFLSQPFAAGLSADALYPNWYNYKFEQKVDSIKTPADFVGVMGQFGASLVVLDSSWNKPERRDAIVAATNLISEFGNISIRRLDSRLRYRKEILINPELDGSTGWSRPPNLSPSETRGTFIVTVDMTAAQSVSVTPGHSYLNTVRARCKIKGAQGRVQVNWTDDKGTFISTDIQTFDCQDAWKEYTQRVTAPRGSTNAVVYAAAHGKDPIEVDAVSFKGD